jgi:hypothetical protein
MKKNNSQQHRTNSPAPDNQSNTIKNPDDWKTGDEEMTGAQRSYLHTLAEEANEEVTNDLTKADAAKKIEELQQKTGRGINR